MLCFNQLRWIPKSTPRLLPTKMFSLLIKSHSKQLHSKPNDISSYGIILNSNMPLEKKEAILLEKELNQVKKNLRSKEKELNQVKMDKQELLRSKENELNQVKINKEELLNLVKMNKEELFRSKENELRSKENELNQVRTSASTTEKLLRDALEKEKIEVHRIQAAYDFIKKTLDARHIIETYETKFKKGGTRQERWTRHLMTNPSIEKKLLECENLNWASKVDEIYHTLSSDIHKQTINIGDGSYLVRITKGLPENISCFVKVLAHELYGSFVKVEEVDP